MSVFESLQREYVGALSTGKLAEFCQNVEKRLSRAPRSLVHWQILARAREAQGNLDGAEACYQQALQLSDRQHPGTKWLRREVSEFARRHQRSRMRESDERVANDQKRGVVPHSTHASLEWEGSQGDTSTDLSSFSGTVEAENVEQELRKVEEAYERGQRGLKLFLCLGQLLQRNGELERAVKVLDEGLSRHKGVEARPLLNARTQVLSALGRWAEAADGYRRLAEKESRPGARRFYRMQLALMYRKDGQIEGARKVLDQILSQDPQDLVVRRLRRSLDYPDQPLPGADAPEENADGKADSLGLYVSQLLLSDLEKAEFRDPTILAKGSKPDVSDALRLMERADRFEGVFGEKYPLFQEAAKAFTQLEPGSWDPLDFLLAVARYALLRGGALVFDFRGKLKHRADLDTLRRLRDTISSYSLETIDVLLRLDIGQKQGRRLVGATGYKPQAGFVFRALTNHLWTHLAFAHACGDAPEVPQEFERDFRSLFEFCVTQPQRELVRPAIESVIACGALSRMFVPWLERIDDGRQMIRLLKDAHAPNVSERNAVLQQLAGGTERAGVSSWDLLRRAIGLWGEGRRVIDEFFSGLRQVKLDPRVFTELHNRWQRFPRGKHTLLSTDLEFADGVQGALALVAACDSRSGEERTVILSRFRDELERLLQLIDDVPTYWGRVRFEPLLKQWRSALANMEKLRLGEMKPLLDVILEPPVFQEQGDRVVGTAQVRNIGRATASGFSVTFSLREPGNPLPLWRAGPVRRKALPVGVSSHIECRVPCKKLVAGLNSPYTLDTLVQVSVDGENTEEVRESFTLEIDSGTEFTQDDVPWDEVRKPEGHLFKGRKRDLDELEHHLRSAERNHTPLLVGLTRTGKSTLLEYLDERLHLKPTGYPQGPTHFCCVMWDFAEAAVRTKERYLWRYLLRDQVGMRIEQLVTTGQLPGTVKLPMVAEGELGPQDWRPVLLSLRSANLYPVFLVDEFTYYRTLADNKLVGPPFLAAMRSSAIEGLASFVFAGTYELREMVSDPAYGVTGQLANVVERRVSSIDEASAKELIGAMGSRLRFTDEATMYIFRLSFRIPYFIQLICKNVAWVAAATNRGWAGYPDVDRVVRVLAGEVEPELPGAVQELSPNVFQKNMYFPDDPKEYRALLSTICCLSHNEQQPDAPSVVSHEAVIAEWERHGVPARERKVADALAELKERQVLVEHDDEGQPAYTISVDLFRRWWRVRHRYLKTELDKLK